MPNPRDPIIQLPTHPIRKRINLINHNSLILQLPPHIIRLLSQIPHRPKHPIQLLILLMHQLHLPLLLQRRIVIIPPPPTAVLLIQRRIKLRRIRQVLGRRSGHGLRQLGAHLLDFPADIVDEFAPALDFVEVEAEAVGVLFDGADGFDQVVEVGGEFGEGCFEFVAGLVEFGVVGRFGEGADPEV